jgi:ribosomal protein S18 acetylase RimI-like enzyme
VGSLAPGITVACSDPDLLLRRSVDSDHPFIRHLFGVVRAETFAAAHLPPEALDMLLDQQFRAQSAGYALQFPGAISLLVERQQRPIGRLLLHCGSENWHVIDIALLSADRGQGVGTDLMQGVEAAARSDGAGMLTLMVLESSRHARRFYARLGFAEIGGVTGAHLAMIKQLAA